MRLRILLETERTVSLPIDHHHLAQAVVYQLLGVADADLARRIHDEGIGVDKGRMKTFTFSTLRVPTSRRRINGALLQIAPGMVDWWLSSPQDDFLMGEVKGLLTIGSHLQFGNVWLALRGVDAIPTPTFGETVRLSCMTPLITSVPSPDGRPTPYYLRPSDGLEFSEGIRKNLLRKYYFLNDALPEDDRFSLTFDPAYLAQHSGTRKHRIRDIEVIGAFAPFTVTGSLELIRLGWDAGFGQYTGVGFGMAEMVSAPNSLLHRGNTGD